MKTAAKKATKKKEAAPSAKQISEHVGKMDYEERTKLIGHLSKVSQDEVRMKGDGQEPDGSGYADYPTE